MHGLLTHAVVAHGITPGRVISCHHRLAISPPAGSRQPSGGAASRNEPAGTGRSSS